MRIKTFTIKEFLTLILLEVLSIFVLTSFSFARQSIPIRTVTGKVTKVSDDDTELALVIALKNMVGQLGDALPEGG